MESSAPTSNILPTMRMPNANANTKLPIAFWSLLFLLPLFYTLHHAAPDYLVVGWQDVVLLSIGYCGILLALYFILQLWWRSAPTALLHTLAIGTVYLFWGYWYDASLRLLGHNVLTKIPVLFITLIASVSFVVYFIHKGHPSLKQKTLKWAALLLLLYCIWDGWQWVINESAAKAEEQREEQKNILPQAIANRNTSATKPPIFLLLFDAMPNTTQLKKHYGIDNSAIDSFLLNKGFWVNEQGKSNYQSTTFSMASLFNARYLTIPAHDTFKDKANQVMARHLIQSNAVARAYEACGYTINNFSIFDFNHHPSPLNTLFVLPVSIQLLNYNTLYGRIEWFLSRNYQSDKAIMAVHEHNNKLTDMVIKQAGNGHAQPHFTYAHFMLPHLPYHYDSIGQLLPPAKVKEVTEADDERYFLYQIPKANEKIKLLVNEIMKQQKGQAVILVLSDHGYGKYLSPEGIDGRFYNFCAVYYPDKNYSRLYPAMTNVNVMRAILGKTLGAELPYLPDTLVSYFVRDIEGADH